jgi:hypothetical protein
MNSVRQEIELVGESLYLGYKLGGYHAEGIYFIDDDILSRDKIAQEELKKVKEINKHMLNRLEVLEAEKKWFEICHSIWKADEYELSKRKEKREQVFFGKRRADLGRIELEAREYMCKKQLQYIDEEIDKIKKGKINE